MLAANAALRSGAGLVTAGIPKSLTLPLSKRLTEVMFKPLPETPEGSLSRKSIPAIRKFLKTQDVLAIGPGLSRNSETQAVVRHLVLGSTIPTVVDADALNAFQGRAASFRQLKAEAILTPHPGEFQRLFGKRVSADKDMRRRLALRFARQYGIVIVLKGHQSVVADPKGQVYVNGTGNPGMATGGSGDVLTGVIAALLGQGLQPFEAAKAGVYLHGLAGDLAAKKIGEVSLIAGDLIEWLPAAFRKVLGR